MSYSKIISIAAGIVVGAFTGLITEDQLVDLGIDVDEADFYGNMGGNFSAGITTWQVEEYLKNNPDLIPSWAIDDAKREVRR